MAKVSLGLTKPSGVLLNLSSAGTSTTEKPLPCYRYICEDSVLFIPAEKKASLARAIGETSLLALGAAGGLLTVAALAPIVAAGEIANRSKISEKRELRSTAEVLAHENKTLEDCIVFPYASMNDLEMEKQSFSLLSVDKNPFKVSIDGSAAVLGHHQEGGRGWWVESNETKGEHLYTILKALTPKTRYGSGGGMTFFSKDYP
jgi:hypothetical protein